MSGTATYTSTLLFSVNSFLSTQISRKTLFSGMLGVGTNNFQTTESQISPSSTITLTAISKIVAVFTDSPVTLILNSGTVGITMSITAITILEGSLTSAEIINGSTTASANIFAISA